MIDALAQRPAWRLLVVGNGDRAAMLEQAERAGVRQRITFAGRVADPERYLAASDALVMPSGYEPWGNAVLEACATGLPVVVAPGQGVNDFVVHEASGLIVEPDAAAIAAALLSLETVERRHVIGEAARVHAANYSFAAVADAYEELLFNRPLKPVRADPATPGVLH